MNIKKMFYVLYCSFVFVVLTSCMKDFLDVKRDKSQVIPDKLSDLEGILLHETMNSFSVHELAEIGSDDYYVRDAHWQTISNPTSKNGYIWADDVFENKGSQDWNRGYEKVLHANFVLEGINKLESGHATNLNDIKRVKGMAYFYRALNYFNLAQLFMAQYDEPNSLVILGLPLRTSSNINVDVPRSNMADTYGRIERDFIDAVRFLPLTSEFKTIPTKVAAYSMLSILKFQQEKYLEAKLYADSAINFAPSLLDFNDIAYNSTNPFTYYGVDNVEIIFTSFVARPVVMSSSRVNVDSILFKSYLDTDLRKYAYFTVSGGRVIFKSSYVGTNSLVFTGITSSELRLVRAECNARLNNIVAAQSDLELLIKHRYNKEQPLPFVPISTADQLLEFILAERRKELVYRGRRWQDLRRLKKDSKWKVVPMRVIDGKVYQLLSNDPKWVWPIPPDVIKISDIEQNPR